MTKRFPLYCVSLTTSYGFDANLQIQGQVGVHQVVILMQIVFNRHSWKQKKLKDRISWSLVYSSAKRVESVGIKGGNLRKQ